MKDMKIYNAHIHTFKECDIPRKFLPLGLVRIISTKWGYNFLSKALNALNPLSSDDALKKYVKFMTIGKMKTQLEILRECSKNYPKDTSFLIHSMDMQYMNAGKVPRNYREQLVELAIMKRELKDEVYPFVHVDPNNPGRDFDFTFAAERDFSGIKIYPPASCHLPDDERLHYIYEQCEKRNMQALAHCGAQSPTRYHASKRKLRKMLDKAGLKWTKDMDRTELAGQFTHPLNYVPLLERYPGMNICFGHWGSEKAWKEYLENPENKENWFYIIRDLIKKYPNAYTDISFTLNDSEYFSVLKIFLQDPEIREKVLFGTDFYMVESKSTEKKFCFDLRAYLGEELFEQIACTNVKKYLKIWTE